MTPREESAYYCGYIVANTALIFRIKKALQNYKEFPDLVQNLEMIIQILEITNTKRSQDIQAKHPDLMQQLFKKEK